ncbi:hypothetical protein BDN72DRAFT_842063 [Pluteus cervinus]|uniref:Uncharacterized protein n=1 Tax=Pluteus cervinus TaxID=181527 RepID=A0ACD3ARW7_9AGAR|nr:hypothetical protein BDN72DRAFT_842063 [Pluteus cervinus]
MNTTGAHHTLTGAVTMHVIIAFIHLPLSDYTRLISSPTNFGIDHDGSTTGTAFEIEKRKGKRLRFASPFAVNLSRSTR